MDVQGVKAAQTKEVIRWPTVGKKEKNQQQKKDFLTFVPGGFVSPCEIHTADFLSFLTFLFTFELKFIVKSRVGGGGVGLAR